VNSLQSDKSQINHYNLNSALYSMPVLHATGFERVPFRVSRRVVVRMKMALVYLQVKQVLIILTPIQIAAFQTQVWISLDTFEHYVYACFDKHSQSLNINMSKTKMSLILFHGYSTYTCTMECCQDLQIIFTHLHKQKKQFYRYSREIMTYYCSNLTAFFRMEVQWRHILPSEPYRP
jgi:hypothetical protein